MPELKSAYRPAWWLPGPHLPTAWGKFGRHRPPVHDRLERVDTPDNDHITLARMGRVRIGKPHLLVLHGLEGKITAKYAHGLLDQARIRGWSGDLMMFRSCDGEVNSARRFYHSGETGDVDLVIRTLIAEHPDVHLLLVGVSLGGNVVLKWLGEQDARVPVQIRRAAAISTPFDLEAGSDHMTAGLGPIYLRHFLETLISKTLQKLQAYPDLVDRQKLLAVRTFREFDNLITGPLHGFKDAHDYYTQSSSIRFLSRIRLDTLLMNAWDDPFLPAVILDRVREVAKANSNLFLEFSERGGHVGWIEGPPWSPRYYMEDRVAEWLGRYDT
jgi:predicted alpha/beta-fold hydrolase